MPWLKMIRGGTSGRTYRLDQGVTVIGRDAVCEVSLDSHEVSKRHCRIVRKAGDFLIEDLGSTNGTRVNERTLAEAHRLADGDVIAIGDFRFAFVNGDQTILSVVEPSTEFYHPGRLLEAVRHSPHQGVRPSGAAGSAPPSTSSWW